MLECGADEASEEGVGAEGAREELWVELTSDEERMGFTIEFDHLDKVLIGREAREA